MITRTKIFSALACAGISVLFAGCIPQAEVGDASNGSLTIAEQQALSQAVGRQIYFDTNLSSPAGQSCASCHLPGAGFADPDAELPVSRGIFVDRFGNRNTPTAAYAAFTPAFQYDASDDLYKGGLFLDGRASTLEDQAKGPFLNPVEMANPDKATVVNKVRQAAYASQFERLFGAAVWNDIETAYDRIADVIAAFERSAEFSPFTSKYDYYLAGKATLTTQEQNGLALFLGKANCAACHPALPSGDGTGPLFTDFTYDNLGVPANSANPFYTINASFNPAGTHFKDLGLGGVLNETAQNGKFKVPTLRNIANTAPYTHNGVFSTLQQVVHFYNTRDTDPGWPTPEVAENVNHSELGNLGLSTGEEADLVAFLRTLSDGYVLP